MTTPTRIHDLSSLTWTVSGFNPHECELGKSLETQATLGGQEPLVPAHVPGSIQGALRAAGLLPDWNVGLEARACEWVENRHWVYEAALPAAMTEGAGPLLLLADGLDGPGYVILDKHRVGCFNNSHIPHRFDLRPYVTPGADARLRIVFTCPPRWLGEFGRTSEMNEMKVRFNYFWDWTSRLVQMGIHGSLHLQAGEACFETLTARTQFHPDSGRGRVILGGSAVAPPDAQISVALTDGSKEIATWCGRASDLARGLVAFDADGLEAWCPHGLGAQPLYQLQTTLSNGDGSLLQRDRRTIGFAEITWEVNPGARADADPWWCHVNGHGLFLAGINWTPILPNFADATEEQYRRLLTQYRDLGFNLMRVWGGATLEKECFYRLCDELGILVWQEFPLSSSGIENMPPDNDSDVQRFGAVARSFVERRMHHVSVAVWCGGNELRHTRDSNKPVEITHPMMRRFAEIVRALDPARRFVTSTPSGPSFGANAADFGKGIHWAVNGPWKPSGRVEDDWMSYFDRDDSLLRSETGAPGASPADLIRKYAGALTVMPVSNDNPLWRRHPWWTEGTQFSKEHGRDAETLEEYVVWSQARQAKALAHAVGTAVARYPGCGGFFIWMGHDSFPCTANTSIIDFDGRPKPAATAVANVLKQLRDRRGRAPERSQSLNDQRKT